MHGHTNIEMCDLHILPRSITVQQTERASNENTKIFCWDAKQEEALTLKVGGGVRNNSSADTLLRYQGRINLLYITVW